VPASNVMVATTHTHGGPATDERGNESAAIRDYVASLCERAVRCALDAAQRTVPARMMLNFGHEPTVGKNRRRAGGLIDPAVQTIRIEDTAGGVIGVLCSYACHPVTLGPDNRSITADYPGAVVRALEATYPGAVAIFATGCAGQINTGHLAEASLAIRPSNVRTFSEADRLGKAIAGAAIQAAEHAAGPRGTPSAVAPTANAREQVRASTVNVDAPWLPIEEPEALRARAAAFRREAQSLDRADEGASVERDRLSRWATWADRVAAIALPEGMRRKTLSGCSAATGEHARPSPNPWRRDPLLNNRGAYALTARVHIPDPVPVGIPVFRVTHLQSTLYCLAWRQAQRSLCGGRNWPS